MIRVQMYSEATGRPRVHPYMRQQVSLFSSRSARKKGFRQKDFGPVGLKRATRRILRSYPRGERAGVATIPGGAQAMSARSSITEYFRVERRPSSGPRASPSAVHRLLQPCAGYYRGWRKKTKRCLLFCVCSQIGRKNEKAAAAVSEFQKEQDNARRRYGRKEYGAIRRASDALRPGQPHRPRLEPERSWSGNSGTEPPMNRRDAPAET